jgi:hypothetical protein
MRLSLGAALLVLAVAASFAAAQVPRDPLANPLPAVSSATSASGSQEPAPFVTKQNDLEIPFNVRTGTSADSQPSSVRVFISWDRGKSWHFYDERKPDDARFRFRAKQDGEFWFATQTLDRSGRPDSAEPRKPQLRLIVDTQRPKLLVQAHVTASGGVNLSWSAADATLLASTLKLEYQDAAGSGGPWQSIEARAPPGSTTTNHGQTTFQPLSASHTINLRAEIGDSAGNVAYYSQRVALSPPKPKETGGLSHDPSATPWPSNPSPVNSSLPMNTPGSQIAADPASSKPMPRERSPKEQVQIPGAASEVMTGPGRLASSPSNVDTLPALTSPSTPIDALTAPQQEAPLPPPPTSVEPLPMQPAPASEPALSPPMEVMPTPPLAGNAEPLDPTTSQHPRLTNSRRFSLEYDLESIGPEGVAAVELWGTNDGGQKWTKWGTDPDRVSPFDVEVSREAVYGFKIVVVGKNGLATTTPQSGDTADIWVSVDLTRPTAKLTGAVYGQGAAAGKLDIRWQAEDANLGSRPITLAICDRPDGRYTTIASGLPNTGEYFWEYDPRSPRQIYLRLEVRDEAGNVTIDQLREPIKVEGLEPKGQIRGFRPAGQNNRGSFRSPLVR